MRLLELFQQSGRTAIQPPLSWKACLRVENLEARLVPYAVTGNAWPNPQLVTMSFVPDGTLMTVSNGANVYSNLFATFGAKWDAATWQHEILTAAQLWAQQANVNFAVVGDNGTPAGGGKYQQGDPGMGDIRIGGYAMSKGFLAGAYMPPPANNYSLAGDVVFNTSYGFNIGSTYDLQTVAIHEIGHSLGLGESKVSGADMYGYYSTIKRALSSDDIAGIQAIYGARKADVYGGANNSFQTAVDLTAQLDPAALDTVVNNLDLVATSSAEYFTVTAPQMTDGTLTVNVQSSGLSLLRPAVTVYAADQATVLGSAIATGDTGSTLSVPISGVNPGDQFYIAVTGADSTAFSTGNFAMSVSFLSTSTPAVKLPNTQVLNGAILTGGGAVPLAPIDALEIAPPTQGHKHHHDDGPGHKDTHSTDPDTRSLAALARGLSPQAVDDYLADLGFLNPGHDNDSLF